MTKKQTFDGLAYEQIKVKLPKSSKSALSECNSAKKAYELAKSDCKKIIKDARRQRKQAKLAYRAAKLTMKAQQLVK
jgi:hypothetical protein